MRKLYIYEDVIGIRVIFDILFVDVLIRFIGVTKVAEFGRRNVMFGYEFFREFFISFYLGSFSIGVKIGDF